ncbi:MAG TPA: site-2 protease family protein, partial [Luteitalea sp.]|nr:site-2 protease family protein [Luteitalea sp.]
MSTPPLPPAGDPDRADTDPASTMPTYRWSDEDNAWVSGPLTPTDDREQSDGRVGHAPWFHLLLFVITFATMTWFGASFYLNYVTAVGLRPVRMPLASALIGGLWFSVPALLILTAHEFGHYFACRYYRIPASLPYFVPLPFVGFFGTLGAVIRMALPRTRRALFDVGIAGPIAGFVTLVPLAVY